MLNSPRLNGHDPSVVFEGTLPLPSLEDFMHNDNGTTMNDTSDRSLPPLMDSFDSHLKRDSQWVELVNHDGPEAAETRRDSVGSLERWLLDLRTRVANEAHFGSTSKARKSAMLFIITMDLFTIVLLTVQEALITDIHGRSFALTHSPAKTIAKARQCEDND